MKSQIAENAQRRAQEIFQQLNAEAGEPAHVGNEPGTLESAPAVEPAPTVLVGEDDPAMLRAGTEEWKHRFEVLQGKYNAEIPRLHDEIRGLKAQLAAVQQQATQPAKTSIAGAMDVLRDELGEHVVEALNRVLAQQATGTEPIPPTPANEPAAQEVPQDANAQAQAAFDQVARMVDGAIGQVGAFHQINQDPAFQQYLAQTAHPQTGQALQGHMAQQFAAGNLNEVTRVFLSFARLRAQQAATQANQARDKIAGPDANGLAGGGQADGQRTYTREEYKASMNALLHDRKYKTPEGMAVADRLRTELMEALRDGRVV